MTEIPISKWGNSSAIRLPKAVMKELGLKPGQSVQLTVKDGKGIIEPVRPKKITLAWIIAEMDRLGPEKLRRRWSGDLTWRRNHRRRVFQTPVTSPGLILIPSGAQSSPAADQ